MVDAKKKVDIGVLHQAFIMSVTTWNFKGETRTATIEKDGDGYILIDDLTGEHWTTYDEWYEANCYVPSDGAATTF